MKTDVYSAMLATTLLFMSGVLVPVNALLGSNIPEPTPPIIEVSSPEPSTTNFPTTETLPKLSADCLIQALTGSSNLLLKTGLLICMYDQGLEADNDSETFQAVFKGLRDTLVGTGCIADGLLGTGDKVESFNETSATVVEEVINQLRPIMDKSRLSPTLMKTACDLVAPALSPDCLSALLAQDVVKLIKDMKKQVCKCPKEYFFYEDIAAALKRLGCLLKCPGELEALLPQVEEGSDDVLIKVACRKVNILVSKITPKKIQKP